MNRTSLLGPNSTSGIVASVFVPIFVGITLTFSWDYIDFLNVVRIGK